MGDIMFKKDKIDKKLSLLTYLVFLVIGVTVALITGRLAFVPFTLFLPSFFFVFYTILSEKEREWALLFGIWEGIGLCITITFARVIFFTFTLY